MAEFDVNLNQQSLNESSQVQTPEELEAQRLAQLEAERQAQLASNIRGENETATEDTFTAEEKRDEQAITQGDKRTYIAENGDEVIETYVEGVLVEESIKHVEDDGKVIETVISYANGKPIKKVVKVEGEEYTEIYEDEELTERIIKQTDSDGKSIESVISYKDGKPAKRIVKKDGNTIETSEYEEKETEEGVKYFVVNIEKPDNTKIEIITTDLDENGNINQLAVHSKITEKPNGEKEYLYKTKDGNVAHTVEKPGEATITDIYNTKSILDYEIASEYPSFGIKIIYESAEIDGKVYEVEYDGKEHTITFAKNGDNISSLCKTFNMTKEELIELNPEIDKKGIKPLDKIVVKGIYEATSPEIKNQGTKQEAYQNYYYDVIANNKSVQAILDKQAGRLDRSYFESLERPALIKLFEYFDLDKNGAVETRFSDIKENKEIRQLIGIIESIAFSLKGDHFDGNGLYLDEAEEVVKQLGLANDVSGQDLLDFCAIAIKELKPLKSDQPFQIIKNNDNTYRVFTYYQDGTAGCELFDESGELLSFMMPTTNEELYTDESGYYLTKHEDINGNPIKGIQNNLFVSEKQHLKNVDYAQEKLFAENEEVIKTIDSFFDDAGCFTDVAMWLSSSDEELEKIREAAKTFKNAVYSMETPLADCDKAALQDYITYSNWYAQVTGYKTVLDSINLAEQSPFDTEKSYNQVYSLYMTLTGDEEKSKELAHALINEIMPFYEFKKSVYEAEQISNANFAANSSEAVGLEISSRKDFHSSVNAKWHEIVQRAFANDKQIINTKYKQSFQKSQVGSGDTTWIHWNHLNGITVSDGVIMSDEEAEEHYKKIETLFNSSYKAAFGKDNPMLEVMKNIGSIENLSGNLKLFSEIVVGTLLCMAIPAGAGFITSGLLNVAGFTVAGTGIDVLEAATSKNGLTSEKFKNILSARAQNIPMLAFGTFVGGPAAQRVGKFFNGLGLDSVIADLSLMSKTGSISAKEFMAAATNNNYWLSTGASFLTETAAFTGFEMVTMGTSIDEAFKNNIGMMGMMRAFGYAAGTMTGQRYRAGKQKARYDAAAEKSGINNWKITESNGKFTVSDANNSLIGQFSSSSEMFANLNSRIAQYISFDKEAANLYKKADEVGGQKIYEEVYGRTVDESNFLTDLKVKKVVGDDGNVTYSAKINGKDVSFDSFTEVIDRCNYEMSIERYSETTSKLFETTSQVTGKDMLKAINKDMPETELPCLENTIIEKSENGYIIKINNETMKAKNDIELAQIVNNIANLDTVNIKMTEFFANAPEDKELSFYSLQKKINRESGIGNIVDDKIAKDMTIRKIVEGDNVKYEIIYKNGVKTYAFDIPEIINISRKIAANPNEYARKTVFREPVVEESDDAIIIPENSTLYFNDGTKFYVAPNDKVITDIAGNIFVQIKGVGEFISLNKNTNNVEIEYNGGKKEGVNGDENAGAYQIENSLLKISSGDNEAVYREIESLLDVTEEPLEANDFSSQYSGLHNFNAVNYQKKLSDMKAIQDESMVPKQRFTPEEINILTVLREKYGNIVDSYINRSVTIDGIEIPVYRSANEVIKMVELSEAHKMLTASLSKLTQKVTDTNGKETEVPLLNAAGVETVIKAWGINSKLTNQLIKNLGPDISSPMTSAKEILAVVEANEINPTLTKELMQIRTEGYIRADGTRHTGLKETSMEPMEKGTQPDSPDGLQKYSEAKFYGDDIKIIVELSKENPKIGELFKNENSGNAVKEFRDAYVENRSFVDRLLNQSDSLGIEGLDNSYYVTELAKLEKNHPELTQTLLNKVYKHDIFVFDELHSEYHVKLDANQIIEILKVANKDNIDVINLALSKETSLQISNIERTVDSRFLPADIVYIAKITTSSNKDIVIKAIEKKSPYQFEKFVGQYTKEGGSYSFSQSSSDVKTITEDVYAYSTKQIIDLARMSAINKDIVSKEIDNGTSFTDSENSVLNYEEPIDIFKKIMEQEFGPDSDILRLINNSLNSKYNSMENFEKLLDLYTKTPEELDAGVGNTQDTTRSELYKIISSKLSEEAPNDRLKEYKENVENVLLTEEITDLLERHSGDKEFTDTLQNCINNAESKADLYKLLKDFGQNEVERLSAEKEAVGTEDVKTDSELSLVQTKEKELLSKIKSSRRKLVEDQLNSPDYQKQTDEVKLQVLESLYFQAKLYGEITEDYVPVLSNVKQKCELVQDTKIKTYLDEELKKAATLGEAERVEKLLELETLADAINSYDENYSMIHTQFAGQSYPAAQAHRLVAIDKKMGGSLKYSQAAMDKINEHIKYDGIKKYIADYSDVNPEMSKHLYSIYLENLSPEIRNKCIEIEEKTGVKLFIDNSHPEQMRILNDIQEEFSLWKDAGLNTPKLLDEFDISINYTMMNLSTGMYAGAFTDTDKRTMSISLSNVPMINASYREILRHELFHLNDPNFEVIIWNKNNPTHQEILSNKEKFSQYMKDAGIQDNIIGYAFTLPREFAPVALQGDISKYPQDFIDVLKRMGVSQKVLNNLTNGTRPDGAVGVEVNPKDVMAKIDSMESLDEHQKETLKGIASERPALVEKMLDNGYQYVDILDVSDHTTIPDSKLCQLVDLNFVDKDGKTVRLDEEDLSTVCSSDNVDKALELSKITIKDKDGNDVPLFKTKDDFLGYATTMVSVENVKKVISEIQTKYPDFDISTMKKDVLTRLFNGQADVDSTMRLLKAVTPDRTIHLDGSSQADNVYNFSIEYCRDKLSEMKSVESEGTNPKQRFTDEEVEILANYYKDYPDFFESVINKKYTDIFDEISEYSFETIDDIMKCYEKNNKLTEYLFNATDNEGNNLYYTSQYRDIVEAFNDKPYEEAVELLQKWEKSVQTQENLDSGVFVTKIKDKNFLNVLSFKIKDSSGKEFSPFNNIEDVYFLDENYVNQLSKAIDNGELENLIKKSLQTSDGNYISDNITFKSPRDGEFQLGCSDITVDFQVNEQGQVIFKSESYRDIDNNGIFYYVTEFANGTKIHNYDSYSEDVGPNLKKELYDKKGNLIRKDEIKSSGERLGEYEITVTKPDESGNLVSDKIGSIKMFGSKKQGSRVSRNVTSPSGDITKEIKIKGPKGTGTKYKILDKNGNTLYESKRTHTQIDENHYTSSHNNQKYDIKFEGDKITVSKFEKNGKISETITLDSDLVDSQLMDLFKQLPGDYFYKLKEMNCKVVYQPENILGDRSYFEGSENTIYISERAKNNPETFAHELGHALDVIALKNLNEDPTYRKIFNEEWEKFVETSGMSEKDAINYYTQNLNLQDHNPNLEFIAQVHTITSGFDDAEHYMQLGNAILQQNFPRSLAYTANKLDGSFKTGSSTTETTIRPDGAVTDIKTEYTDMNDAQLIGEYRRLTAGLAEGDGIIKNSQTIADMVPELKRRGINYEEVLDGLNKDNPYITLKTDDLIIEYEKIARKLNTPEGLAKMRDLSQIRDELVARKIDMDELIAKLKAKDNPSAKPDGVVGVEVNPNDVMAKIDGMESLDEHQKETLKGIASERPALVEKMLDNGYQYIDILEVSDYTNIPDSKLCQLVDIKFVDKDGNTVRLDEEDLSTVCSSDNVDNALELSKITIKDKDGNEVPLFKTKDDLLDYTTAWVSVEDIKQVIDEIQTKYPDFDISTMKKGVLTRLFYGQADVDSTMRLLKAVAPDGATPLANERDVNAYLDNGNIDSSVEFLGITRTNVYGITESFTPDQIRIMKNSNVDIAKVKELAKETYTDKDGNEQPRFSINDLYRLSVVDRFAIDKFKALKNEDGSPMLSGEEISFLSSCRNIDDAVNLLKIKIQKANGQSHIDVDYVRNFVNKGYDVEHISRLFDMKYRDGRTLLDATDVSQILESGADINTIEKLYDMRGVDHNGQEQSLRAWQAINLAEKEFKDVYELYKLEAKDENGNTCKRFTNLDDIYNLSEYNVDDVVKLANIKRKDNGTPLLPIERLRMLAELGQTDKVARILNISIQDGGEAHFQNSQIKRIIDENIDVEKLEKLANHKYRVDKDKGEENPNFVMSLNDMLEFSKFDSDKVIDMVQAYVDASEQQIYWAKDFSPEATIRIGFLGMSDIAKAIETIEMNGSEVSGQKFFEDYAHYSELTDKFGNRIFDGRNGRMNEKEVLTYMASLPETSKEATAMRMLTSLVQDGQVGAHTLKYLPREGHINPLIADDVRLFYEAHLNNIPLNDVLVPTVKSIGDISNLNIGDVFEVAGEKNIYIKNREGKPTQLQMDKATYCKLFPPIERYATTQNSIGNCWQITGFNGLLRDPVERLSVLETIKQDGNDIVIKFQNGKIDEIRFYNGELPEGADYQFYSEGALGVNLLEFAQAREIHRDEVDIFFETAEDGIKSAKSEGERQYWEEQLARLTETFEDNPDNLVVYVEDGKYVYNNDYMGKFDFRVTEHRDGGNEYKVWELLGYETGAAEKVSDRQMDLVNPKFFEENIVGLGSGGHGERDIRRDKGIVSGHAYRVRPNIDENGVIVNYEVLNPWGICESTVTLSELMKYYDQIYIGKRKGGNNNSTFGKTVAPWGGYSVGNTDKGVHSYRGVTDKSSKPDKAPDIKEGNSGDSPVLTEAQIADMKAHGEIISVKSDGSVHRFDPMTKKTVQIGNIAESDGIKGKVELDNHGNDDMRTVFRPSENGISTANAISKHGESKESTASKASAPEDVKESDNALDKKLSINSAERLKSFGITDIFTDEELHILGTEISEQKGIDKDGKPIYELTKKGEELVWKAARQIRKAALKQEPTIVEYMRELGLTSDTSIFTDKDGNKLDIAHRSKGDQSLHDKIRTKILSNVKKGVAIDLAMAVSDVSDAVGCRTASFKKSYAEEADVKAALDNKDTKTAIMLAVEHESQQVYEALIKYIDSVADGTNKVEITRISNYIGEDGIPYFTERQLGNLKAHAARRRVNIPHVELVYSLAERFSSQKTDIYNPDATTQVRGSGYTALQMNFRDKSTGFVYEWQYRGEKVNEFAEGEHVPYDLRTGKDIIGQNKELTELYEPMKKILNKENMSPQEYTEYENYLTAYYEYLRMEELGLNDGTNPPKLPAKFDARLRAENLMLLHEYSEKIKKNPKSASELTKEYESKLIKNTPENTTTESYTDKVSDKKQDRVIDRYEAARRIGEINGFYNEGKYSSIVIKACRDNGTGEIRENLVKEAESLQMMGVEDKIIAGIINKIKETNIRSVDKLIENFKRMNIEFNENEIASFLDIALSTGQFNYTKMVDIAHFYKSAPVGHEVLSHIYEKISSATNFADASNVKGAAQLLCQTFNASTLGYMKTNQSLIDIIDNCFDKTGKIDSNTVDVVNSLLQCKLDFSKIPNILTQARNSTDNKIYGIKNSIADIIKKTNYFTNTGWSSASANSHVLTEILKSLRRYDRTPNGWVSYPAQPRIDLFNNIESRLNANPSEASLYRMYRVSQIMLGARDKKGIIQMPLVDVGIDLVNAKYSFDSVKEILNLQANGKQPDIGIKLDNITKKFPINDFANVESIDITVEDGIAKRLTRYNNGNVLTEDFDINTYEKKGEYNSTTPKKQGRTVTEIDDTIRGLRTRIKREKNNTPYEETTVIKDPATGEVLGIEYLRASSEIEGGFDIQYRDIKNGGTTETLSESRTDEFGNITIRKDYNSLDGTNTKFDYSESPDGSYTSHNQITDEYGTVIFDETRTFTVIDATHCESICNGKKYLIEITDDNVLTVTKKVGNGEEKVSFDLDELSGQNMNNPNFVKLFKHIPGHEFFQMAKVKTARVKDANVISNAHYLINNNTINLGRKRIILSTFLHEFGHNKDFRLYPDPANNKKSIPLSKDVEIQQQYEEERKAFVQAFPSLQREFIDYFIGLDKKSDRENRGLSEVIAEANLLLNTNSLHSFRGEYLRRYFPKTIALVAKKLNPEIYTN